MLLPFPHCAAPDRTQSVVPNRRRGARGTQVVAFPGHSTPESAYNLAGVAGQAPARRSRL
jgi:hypothetical protein